MLRIMKPWNPNIRVQRESFDLSEESRRLTAAAPTSARVVSFTGYCRDEGGTLAALELEHYPGMAEEEIAPHRRRGGERWPLLGLTIIHRHGRIAARRADRARARRLGAPPGRLRGGVLPHGLPEDPRSLLEEGAPQPTGRAGDWVAAKARDDSAAEKWKRWHSGPA